MSNGDKNKQDELDQQEYWNYLAISNSHRNLGNIKNSAKPNKVSNEKRYISKFTILGHIEVACAIIMLIIMCIFYPEPVSIFSFIISSIISIACLYGLGGARERLACLEEDFETLEKKNSDTSTKLKRIEKELKYKVDIRDKE